MVPVETCVFSLVLLGRGSGGHFGIFSKLCSPLIGVVFGLLLGVTEEWQLLAFALAGWLSEKPDPASDSLGAITDGHGTLKDYLQLSKRGLIGAVPYLPLSLFAPAYCLLLFVFAWPFAVYVGTKLPRFNAWEWSEILRYSWFDYNNRI
jgi:hypothetical protein